MNSKKTLKIAAAATVLVIALAALAVGAALVNATIKSNRLVKVEVAPVAYATGAVAVERGRYLYLSRGCAECHGEGGEGRVFIDHPNGLYARGANLTSGPGSAVSGYTERDWVRSIRHGVAPDGKPLFPMPSEDFNQFNDQDLADLVAFIRALPAKHSEGELVRLPLQVRIAYGAGLVKDAAEKIDHSRQPPPPVATGPTVQHGRYVAQVCIGCHGADLNGGRIPGAPPDWPPAADITAGPDGVMRRYDNFNQFKRLMQTAKRPDGSQVNAVMPFGALKHMSDVDLEALYLFLKSTPSGSTG